MTAHYRLSFAQRRSIPLGSRRKQVAYGDWKASMFSNIGVSRSSNGDGAVFHE